MEKASYHLLHKFPFPCLHYFGIQNGRWDVAGDVQLIYGHGSKSYATKGSDSTDYSLNVFRLTGMGTYMNQ